MAAPLKVSTPLANDMLAGESLIAALGGGFLILFSGPVPDDCDAALNMDDDHTQLSLITVGNDGTTGLTFEATAANGAIQKTIGQNWSGSCTFDGANDGDSTQLATFFRFIAAADIAELGRTEATTQKRLQGTIGALGTNMILTNPTLTAGNVQAINTFQINMPRG